MMVKFKKLFPTEHQTGYTHGMHVLQKTAKNLLSKLFPVNPDGMEFIQEVHSLGNLDENLLSLEDEFEEPS